MKKNLLTKFVGMDVHQKSISIAIADDGPDGEVRLYGPIRNTGEAMRFLINTLVIYILFVTPSFLYAAENLDERFKVVLPAVTGIFICFLVIYLFIKIIGWLKRDSKKFDNGAPKS